MAAALSPDEERLVLALQGALWTVPVTGGDAERITGGSVEATHPSWSPDGSRIAFQSFSDHYYQIWTVAPDGRDLRQVTEGPYDHREPAWSPDGGRIAFSSDRALQGSYDIWTVEVETGAYARRTDSDAEEHSPAWSPDGSRLAYAVGPTVRAVDGGGADEELVALSGGSVRVPSFTPDGTGLVHQDDTRQWVVGGRTVTSGEDIFPFPVTWFSDGRFVYTADGGIQVRGPDGREAGEILFRAELVVDRPPLQAKDHGFDDPTPRLARGIFSPVLSPDGRGLAFTALGDVWVMDVGGNGRPRRLTDDSYVEWGPSWSPDGGSIYFSSDRAGTGRPDLYAVEPDTGEVIRISEIADSRMVFPTLSPDGTRVAYIDGGDQSLRVYDIPTGSSRRVASQAYASNVGKPTWSPDGRTIALADIQQISTRHREGRNLIRTVDVETGEWRFHEPGPYPDQLSERFEAGPAWSPDGAWMAFIMGSTLHVIPVDSVGTPTGPARELTDEAADMPSWGPDSETILYLSNGRLRRVGLDGDEPGTVPVELGWSPAVAEGEVRILAGRLWDGVEPALQQDMEIVIRDGRIVAVEAGGSDARARAEAEGARFIDASELTVMPGMWDAHVHPRVQDFTGQWWAVQLAYGLTTVLSNGVSTYHTLLAHESLEAGRWVGPRLLTAPIFDGQRPYYGHHRSVPHARALELELEKARELEMDYLKAYVRAPVSFMGRIAEAAREMGVPSGSHFLSPGIQVGLGGTTHLSASQRMGYSWAESAAGESYEDVIDLYVQGAFHLSSHHTRTNQILGDDPGILEDPRFLLLMPPNYRAAVEAQASRPPTAEERERVRRNVATPARILRGGGLVTIGSDTPLSWPALGLHAQLRALSYEVTSHEALQAVTINAARYAQADRDLGTVEPGKIADLVLVRGDPLEDVANAARVEIVLKNGVPWTVEEILAPYRVGERDPPP